MEEGCEATIRPVAFRWAPQNHRAMARYEGKGHNRRRELVSLKTSADLVQYAVRQGIVSV